MSAERIAVIGGGLAGLAAALECADAGAEVTLYEARTRLGGATFSVRRRDHWIDNGQHVFVRACSAYLGFLERLGTRKLVSLEPLRVPVLREASRPALLRRNGLPAPLQLAGSLLRYRPLSVGERLAAMRAAAAMRRLDPDDPALDEQSFAEWLRGRGQSERGVTGLWELIALATLNVPVREASLASALKVFRTALLETKGGGDIGVATVPLQQLHGGAAKAALAAAGVRVELAAVVSSVRSERSGLRLELARGVEEADAVICAVPHQVAAGLLPAGVVDAAALERLGSSPIVNLHLHYDRPVLAEPMAAALDSPVQWLFDRTASSGVDRGQLVTVSLSAARDEIGLPLRALRERFVPALSRLLPAAAKAELLDFAVTREPRATFCAVPGSRRLRPAARTDLPGLYLAGAWTDTGWPATMEGAVRSGLTAAGLALSDLAAASSARKPVLASAEGSG
ncbi:MAG: hydroxysqualene dehydroxylase HpnE [Gaiellaceae bacterium]